MFTSLIRLNTARSRPLSPATLQRIRAALHAALNGAIRRELITTNPAHWVELPPGRRPKAAVWTDPRVAHWRATGERPPVAVWTPQQTAAFLAHVRDHEWYPLFHLIALLGFAAWRGGRLALMRPRSGQAGADGVPPAARRRGRTIVCPPKTETSVRVVALDHHTVSLLRRPRARRSAERAGVAVPHPAGRPINPAYLTREFSRQVARAGLPPIRLHDLRHGATSQFGG